MRSAISASFSHYLTIPSHPSLGRSVSSGRIVVHVYGSLGSYIVGPRVLVTVTCRLVLHKLATSA